MAADGVVRVDEYHDGTKHFFHRFAPASGYLDWASQPRPFRSFEGAPTVSLYPRPDAPGALVEWAHPTYDQLFHPQVLAQPLDRVPVTAGTIGHFFRYALGLSAWKAIGKSRWSLRVNPSSGNLHPTEAYLVTGALAGLGDAPGVWHYAPDRHVLEQRAVLPASAWQVLGAGEPGESFLVALTSIHWRESWKYGERAFRYCQHDIGHAIAALSLSAAVCGWRMTMLPTWPHRAVATLGGLDRDDDYFEREREEPAGVFLVSADHQMPGPSSAAGPFLDCVRQGTWHGRASQLSEAHVVWRFIDAVARATEDPGRAVEPPPARSVSPVEAPDRALAAETVLLQRRSAVAFDGSSVLGREPFVRMLLRTLPGSGAPWNALWWSPRIHLVLFVHRVEGVMPGLYLLMRDEAAAPRVKLALSPAFGWETQAAHASLRLLRAGDVRLRARQLSCDQDIAADGFFSLAMIAEFGASLAEHGPSFYRQLFWEAGVIGQVLYLEAEAAGARGTGIGCFYDDPVHELLGLHGHSFQSLYHFTVGMPVEDRRLTTEPGYTWERPTPAQTAVDS